MMVEKKEISGGWTQKSSRNFQTNHPRAAHTYTFRHSELENNSSDRTCIKKTFLDPMKEESLGIIVHEHRKKVCNKYSLYMSGPTLV
jgi:hypothetical protein